MEQKFQYLLGPRTFIGEAMYLQSLSILMQCTRLEKPIGAAFKEQTTLQDQEISPATERSIMANPN